MRTKGTLPVRVLFCQPTAQLTGSEKSLLEIVRALDRKRVVPFVLLGEEGPVAEELRATGAEVAVIRSRKLARSARALLGFAASFPRVAAAIRRLRKSWALDAAYVNTLMFPQATLGARLARLPVLTHVREVSTTYPRGVYAVFSAVATALSVRIICPCAFVLRQRVPFARSFRRKARVVHNASAFPIPDRERRLSAPLRLLAVIPTTVKKGVLDLPECLDEIRRLAPGVTFRLDVVGRIFEPEPFAGVRRRLHELGLDAHVHFHGEQRDLLPFYEAAHVLLHPSHSEAFPRTLVEAMNLGLPCVTTDAGGCAEAIVEGKTGYVVPIGEPRRMAARVLEVAGDEAAYARLAASTLRRYSESFTSPVMAERIAAIVLEALDLAEEP